jgi:hypothetical protein
MLGDVVVDRSANGKPLVTQVVDAADIGQIARQFGMTGSRLLGDANGDGRVDALDRFLALRSQLAGKRLNGGLNLDD